MKSIICVVLLLTSIKSFAQVVTLDTITAWGYELNPHEPYMENFCAGGIVSKSGAYQSIRTIKDTTGKPRYRFTLGKEVYQSIENAESMVTEIQNPLRRTSKHSKLCDIRRAFNIGAVVYFVHTDVNYPRQKIESILSKLYQNVVKK